MNIDHIKAFFVKLFAACFFLIVLIASAFLFPIYNNPPRLSGIYSVGMIQQQLTDVSRKELLVPGDNSRQLLIDIYYPSPLVYSERALRPYPKKLRDALCATYANKLGIPQWIVSSLLPKMARYSSDKAPLAQEGKPFPLILFSPGIGGCQRYDTYLEELASWGYVVVAVNHTYDHESIVFPDGHITGLSDEFSQIIQSGNREKIYAYRARAHQRWLEDVQFVFDTLKAENNNQESLLYGLLDENNVGVLGHSHGGGVAIDLCKTKTWCKVGIDMDGWTKTANTAERFEKPFLFLLHDADDFSSGGFAGFEELSANMKNYATRMVIPYAGHAAFSQDILLRWPFAHHFDVTTKMFLGPFGQQVIQTKINAYIRMFFDKHLKQHLFTPSHVTAGQLSLARSQQRVLIVSDTRDEIGGANVVLSHVMAGLKKQNYLIDHMNLKDVKTIFGKVLGVGVAQPLGLRKEIAWRIDSFKPDSVLIVLLGPLSYIAGSYCYDQKIPFTVFYPSRIPEIARESFCIPQKLSYYFVRKLLNKANNTLVPSPSLVHELASHGVNNPTAWPHGIDTSFFTIPTVLQKKETIDRCGLDKLNRPFYLYVGRLSKTKNIQAFLDLDLPGTKILVGPEDIGYSIKSLRQKYPDVVFAGPQYDKGLLDFYQASDVFVFPSKADTFGLVLLEALACGLPVVAFNEMGPRDVVPPSSGVSFLAKTDQELKQGALDAWRALHEGAITQEKCRVYASTFSWDNAVNQLIKTFKS